MEFPQKQATQKNPLICSLRVLPGPDSIYWKMEYSTTKHYFQGYIKYPFNSQSTQPATAAQTTLEDVVLYVKYRNCIIPPDNSIQCRESIGYEIFKNILKFIFSTGERENTYFAKVRHQANKPILAMTCLIKK